VASALSYRSVGAVLAAMSTRGRQV
jgi:hypothetical protein